MHLNNAQQLSWIYELYQLGQIDTQYNDTKQVYERMLQHFLTRFATDCGSLTLCQNEEDNIPSLVVNVGALETEQSVAASNKVVALVLDNRQAMLLNGNISRDPSFDYSQLESETQTSVSQLAWPLQIRKDVFGVLSICSFSQQIQYTQADLERGQPLVNLIALVIDNVCLHISQQQRIQQLIETKIHYEETNQLLQITKANLLASEQRLFDILDSVDSIIWSMEPDTLKLLYLNKAAFDVSGYAVDDFINDANLWLNIVDPADRVRVETSLQEIMRTGTQIITYRIIRPDRSVRWLFHHMRLVRNSIGTPERIDGITVDITQHKLAEDLLKQRNQELQSALDKIQEVQRQLIQSEKLSSIGQLAAGVAHEINNPIGYINSNLSSLKKYVEELLVLISKYEALESDCSNAEKVGHIQQYKTKIDLEFTKVDVLDLLSESQEGASRVKKIVQDLKDFSHAGGGDVWQWSDLHSCLDSTLNISNNEIKYKAQVIKDYGVIPQIWCLPQQLNQVFMNLLVNAAHAIEKNGTIKLSTKAEGGNILIEISDNGKGIAPEHIDKIFDPFFTTKPVGQGTGLGLSVSYSIIKKHQGEIRIDSKVGVGTCFRVILPINVDVNAA
ncbi:ATP-binding protein [Methylomonas sp. AM2-LC]|uniref:GAF domain-containing sensor histidine kinase n=1 Tax=Methylomonas sp. AM2-LC TaxID=3153301 RepID=UPI003267903E